MAKLLSLNAVCGLVLSFSVTVFAESGYEMKFQVNSVTIQKALITKILPSGLVADRIELYGKITQDDTDENGVPIAQKSIRVVCGNSGYTENFLEVTRPLGPIKKLIVNAKFTDEWVTCYQQLERIQRIGGSETVTSLKLIIDDSGDGGIRLTGGGIK